MVNIDNERTNESSSYIYIQQKEPSGDGGCPRIPSLRTKNNQGVKIHVNDNEDKAKIFAKSFFRTTPETPADKHKYPEPLPDPPQITADQLTRQIKKTIAIQGTWPRWHSQHSSAKKY